MDLRMRKAQFEDAGLIFSWRTNSAIQEFSLKEAPASYDAHLHWFANRVLSLDSNPFWLFSTSESEVGYTRFEKQAHNAFSVSILVNPSFWGKGYGRKMLQQGIEAFASIYPKSNLTATIHSENIPSIRIFENEAFMQTGQKNNFLVFEKLNSSDY